MMVTPLATPADRDYWAIQRVSNSRLTQFRNWLFGIREPDRKLAYSLGSALHERLLEPHKATPLPKSVSPEHVDALERRLREHPLFGWYSRFSEKETIRLFTDPDTGLACKAKLDLVYKNATVLDLKTTMARSQRDFVVRCREYDYDRQAAFYLDSLCRKPGCTPPKFLFVGIQKVEPYGLYLFDATAEPGFVEFGRKKYKTLLKKWKEVDYDTVEGEPWGVFN
ncbi:MAG: PD-(D/E)XK nuclease-like domain-containing protein [Sphingobacteriaceae bacterium]|nr:PD-(D/E)XK nuclease-like domain-containing protein [Cytophagaceae bacterium]